MKHIIYILLLAFCPLATLQADNLTPIVSVVPCPVQMVPGTGNFLFSGSTVLRVENAEQARVARNFVNLFTRAAGFTPVLKTGKGKGDVCFVSDPLLKSGAYRLSVSPEQISIEASDAKGFFYALQTIRQLLPPDIENSRTVNAMWTVPCLTIQDEPRFGYRGLMLDVSRFFIPKESVLRIIDCMAMLKINKFHFHLVDDNGWRLEIKKYPRLTEIGAWRVDHTDVPFHSRRNPLPGEPTPVGGFYTQEDMKEMIAYAADRQVEIIPEIEMPAHTNSSLAAYPQLACPGGDQFIGVLPGLGGDHASIIYCAGNDSVFTFLQNVIDEVAALFPSRYIHLGGDEAQKTYWKKCPLCQERMKKEHLAHEEDLQGYFMKRIGEYVRSKGKEVMGWDELTNSFIPEGAVIFGWQGMGNAALKAADRGHRFVMTPARVMYLIRYQGPQILQLLDRVCEAHAGKHPELYEVRELFQESWIDLNNHLTKEEMVLFPYIYDLFDAVAQHRPIPAFHCGSVSSPISVMMSEHDAEGERFRRISGLTHGYLVPGDACSSYRLLLEMLRPFEDNLHHHIHLENNIVFPKAIELQENCERMC